MGPSDSGTTYYYRIRAENSASMGAWSAPDEEDGTNTLVGAVSAITHKGVPGMPGLMAAQGIPNTSSITITWMPPAVDGNGVIDDGGSVITSYELQVWDSANSRWVDETSMPADADDVDDTAYTYPDTGLASGKTYYYRVRARNAEGPSAWSEFDSASTAPADPGIPTLTPTALSPTEIRLSWTVPSDGGSAITDYNLVSWGPSSSSWSDDELGADITATLFVDGGLTAGETYYYRIQAVSGDKRRRMVCCRHRSDTLGRTDQACIDGGGHQQQRNPALMGGARTQRLADHPLRAGSVEPDRQGVGPHRWQPDRAEILPHRTERRNQLRLPAPRR